MDDPLKTIELATELTAAWLANPHTRADADAVPAFLTAVHGALAQLADGGTSVTEQTADETPAHVPAVGVRKSLGSPDHIISMIDGKPYRTLRRHLSTHGLTPDEYRTRYNLKPDYPMVAPAYSEARRAMAKQIGLDRKPASPAPVPETVSAAKPRRRKLGVAIDG